jgi:hypothetical protein
MSDLPPRLRAIAVAVAAVALTAPLVADAASPRDTLVRDRISSVTKEATVQSGVSANFWRPATWTLRSHTSASRTYRGPSNGACTYDVRVSTRVTPDKAQSATEHVTDALPVPTRARVLETGTRNASAWRIVRPLTTDGRVRVDAMLATRRGFGAGTKAWHEIRVNALSRPGNECHSGTYRETLRMQVGDLLATSTGRIYQFTPR